MLRMIFGLTFSAMFSYIFINGWGNTLEWNNVIGIALAVLSGFCSLFCLYLNEKFKSTTDATKRDMAKEFDDRMKEFRQLNDADHLKVAQDARARAIEVERRLDSYVRHDIYQNDRDSDRKVSEQAFRMVELQLKNINEKLSIILKIKGDQE